MLELINNKEKQQYEFHVDGNLARLEYEIRDELVLLLHIELDPKIRGKGIAAQLIEAVLTELQSKGLKVKPYCFYIKTYIARHPEWEILLG